MMSKMQTKVYSIFFTTKDYEAGNKPVCCAVVSRLNQICGIKVQRYYLRTLKEIMGLEEAVNAKGSGLQGPS